MSIIEKANKNPKLIFTVSICGIVGGILSVWESLIKPFLNQPKNMNLTEHNNHIDWTTPLGILILTGVIFFSLNRMYKMENITAFKIKKIEDVLSLNVLELNQNKSNIMYLQAVFFGKEGNYYYAFINYLQSALFAIEGQNIPQLQNALFAIVNSCLPQLTSAQINEMENVNKIDIEGILNEISNKDIQGGSLHHIKSIRYLLNEKKHTQKGKMFSNKNPVT